MDALPTLSVDGFLTTKAGIMIKLYEYFMASDYSQSNTFLGDIASMKYIAATATDINELTAMTKDALEKMYLRYFPTVVVEITPYDRPNNMEVVVDIVATDDTGVTHTLKNSIKTVNNVIVDYGMQQELAHG